jgi:hypothetical protein
VVNLEVVNLVAVTLEAKNLEKKEMVKREVRKGLGDLMEDTYEIYVVNVYQLIVNQKKNH